MEGNYGIKTKTDQEEKPLRLSDWPRLSGSHLQRTNILPSASCTICQQEDSIMNDAHLPQCPVLNPKKKKKKKKKIVQLHWEARRLIA